MGSYGQGRGAPTSWAWPAALVVETQNSSPSSWMSRLLGCRREITKGEPCGRHPNEVAQRMTAYERYKLNSIRQVVARRSYHLPQY